jgi:hypothetical protein
MLFSMALYVSSQARDTRTIDTTCILLKPAAPLFVTIAPTNPSRTWLLVLRDVASTVISR